MPSAFDCHDTASGFDCKIRINTHDVYGPVSATGIPESVFIGQQLSLRSYGKVYPPASGRIANQLPYAGQISISGSWYYKDRRQFAFDIPSGTVATSVTMTGRIVVQSGHYVPSILYIYSSNTGVAFPATTGVWANTTDVLEDSGIISGVLASGSSGAFSFSIDPSRVTAFAGKTMSLWGVTYEDINDIAPASGTTNMVYMNALGVPALYFVLNIS